MVVPDLIQFLYKYCSSSLAFTYCFAILQILVTAQTPPVKLGFVYNSSAYNLCVHKYKAIFNPTFMVNPPNILSERDRTNDTVVEACNYGALNFKPENTSTKVLDYNYKVFLGYFCNVSKGCRRRSSIEAAKLNRFIP